MRPVRLDLDGFASFRDPAVVDFIDANHFAFVGPTGAGKSTVIDAMTFALYGSAPRWGSVSSIQYALAPTANRCTVRLVFDVANQRYVVAREVRRSGAQIMQKNAVLERYADPHASADPAADEPTESLAGDTKDVRRQITDLLGLDFDDFCTCVVLPQGDFATFLKASVTERQNILLKLLGAKHYDAIGKLAGRRASAAETRSEVLAGELRGYADATEEAEQAARERESELGDLASSVRGAVDRITEAAEARAEATAHRATLIDEIERLGSLSPPLGVAETQTAVTSAEQAYTAALELERTTAVAAMRADDAVRSEPHRPRLEESLRWRDELESCLARQSVVDDEDRKAAQASNDAAEALVIADRRLESHRANQDAARSRRAEAAGAVEALEQRIAMLGQAWVPDGVAQLAERGAAARAARDEAETARVTAEATLAEAVQAVDRLPERSALDHLLDALTELDQTKDRLRTLGEQHDTALAVAAAAEGRLQDLADRRDAARAAFDELRTKSAAADLRPQLSVGHACPVCGQSVTTLPPQLEVPELAAARELVADAEVQLNEATTAHHRAAQRVTVAEMQLDLASERITQLDRALAKQLPSRPSGPDRDLAADRRSVTELVESRDRALTRQRAAQQAHDQVRDTRRRAEEQHREIEQEASKARSRLHTTRGPLVALGAPAVDDTDLAAAWAALSGWAQSRADELTTDLTTARAELAGAVEEFGRMEGLVHEASDERSTRAQALTEAAVTAELASAEHRRLLQRLAELTANLVDRPTAAEVRELLRECERREAGAESARAAAQEAAENRRQIEQRREASRAEQAKARAALHQARDGLARLGAPSVDDTDVACAWVELSSWSTRQAKSRRDQLVEVDAALTTAGGRLDRELMALAADLDEHGIDLADRRIVLTAGAADAPAQALHVPQVLAVSQERARAHTAEIASNRHKAAELTRRIAADTETAQVAAELQRLMSSKRFPQWLADAALDTLVADASASLLRLSNNQFELTHDRGEFYVIDHTDADSRRSVRTLSGGETFQASLALALALSEHLATLAAGGRATLDSIFLDEGFGTLDPDALEIVAGTLENLAQEDRMVGVITHVTGLAERAPVRFEVRRDSRTSTIARIGL